MIKIEPLQPGDSPAPEVDLISEEYQSRQLKNGIIKNLRKLIRASRSTMFVESKINSRSIDAKDLYIIVIYPVDKSLLDIFFKLTRSFLAMALGVYDKRIPAPWDSQPKLIEIPKVKG